MRESVSSWWRTTATRTKVFPPFIVRAPYFWEKYINHIVPIGCHPPSTGCEPDESFNQQMQTVSLRPLRRLFPFIRYHVRLTNALKVITNTWLRFTVMLLSGQKANSIWWVVSTLVQQQCVTIKIYGTTGSLLDYHVFSGYFASISNLMANLY